MSKIHKLTVAVIFSIFLLIGRQIGAQIPAYAATYDAAHELPASCIDCTLSTVVDTTGVSVVIEDL